MDGIRSSSKEAKEVTEAVAEKVAVVQMGYQDGYYAGHADRLLGLDFRHSPDATPTIYRANYRQGYLRGWMGYPD